MTKKKLSEQYPDLPVVSFNQLLTWDRCVLLWKYKYVDKWSRAERGHRMELGTMGHAMLFDWYKTGIDHSEDFAKRWLSDIGSLDAEQMQNINVATAQFKLYRELFSPVADRGLETKFLEYHFEVMLTTPTGEPFILQGYIDRGSVDEQGRLWIEDYKWTQRFWSPSAILMHPQLTYYAGAMRALGMPVHGLMITQVNTYPYVEKTRAKKTVDDLFRRERFARSDIEIDNVMYEVGVMVDEMFDMREALDPFYRRSLQKDCEKCDFQDPCLMGLKGDHDQIFMYNSPVFFHKKKSIRQEEGGIPELQKGVRIPDDYVVDEESQSIRIE